ncbi:MAG TPA: DUF4065 domain-containing protein [Candidatus Ozemobacteraceae bacterium]|nr:DUF4065 domain-containing protein [Candidatus Ozemobacteraceae bacterium]
MERLEHAICFFAREFKKQAKKPLQSMGLYKLLALLEFRLLKKTGRPVFGLDYLAMRMGPVPVSLYEKRNQVHSRLFSFTEQGENRFSVDPIGNPDMDYFSGVEVAEMRRLVEIFSDPQMTTALFSEASHQEIMAWSRAYRKQPNSPIDFKDEFPGDIDTKKAEDLTPEEESFLFWRGAQILNAAG